MAEGVSLSDGLFAMHKHEVFPSDPIVTKCYSADVESLQLWHERLGHLSKSHVKSFLKGLGYDVIVNEEFCDGCQFGKHHRSNFGTLPVRSQKTWRHYPFKCVRTNGYQIIRREMILRSI